MTLGILTYCFMQRPSYLLICTPPSSTFIKSFISFDSSFHKVFGHFLGPGSFESPEGPLVHKQASFPITFDGVGLILTSTITLVTYLGSWAFVVLVIVARFMVYQHPFLLEALAQVDNNTFYFQQHLKVACDLLPPPACACLPPFNNSLGNKWFNFKIPFQSVYTIIPFPTCSLIGHVKLIMPKFYHVLA